MCVDRVGSVGKAGSPRSPPLVGKSPSPPSLSPFPPLPPFHASSLGGLIVAGSRERASEPEESPGSLSPPHKWMRSPARRRIPWWLRRNLLPPTAQHHGGGSLVLIRRARLPRHTRPLPVDASRNGGERSPSAASTFNSDTNIVATYFYKWGSIGDGGLATPAPSSHRLAQATVSIPNHPYFDSKLRGG